MRHEQEIFASAAPDDTVCGGAPTSPPPEYTIARFFEFAGTTGQISRCALQRRTRATRTASTILTTLATVVGLLYLVGVATLLW